MSTSEVLGLIRNKYKGNEYAVFEEVRNAAGFSARRSADVMIMNLWPSRGLELIGMEVKVSRTDWLKELKSPAKAEAFIQYCDRWYLVVGDEKIIADGELPPTWGLMVAKGKRLITVKDAPKLTPGPISKGFVACMFKRATEGLIHRDEIQDEIDQAIERYKTYNTNDKDRLEKQLIELTNGIREFEKASGVSISGGWRNKKEIGEAVRFIMNGGTEKIQRELNQFQLNINHLKDRVDQAFETFKL